MNAFPLRKVAIVALAGALGALAMGLSRKVMPNLYAEGIGMFALFMGVFPLNKQWAESTGRSYRLGRHIVASCVAGIVAIGVGFLLDKVL